MGSSTRRTFAGILLIFGAVLFVRAQVVQPKEPPSTISGKVTIKGKAAPGIFIVLHRNYNNDQGLTRFKGVSDYEGKYRIEGITPGMYAVTPITPAYIFEENTAKKVLNVATGETIENVDFALVLGGAITGRVTDAQGNPRIEEQVYVLPDFPYTRPHLTFMRARTDDRGVYRVFGLAKGRYRVAAGSANAHSGRNAAYKQTFHLSAGEKSQATVIDLTEGGEAINVDIILNSTLTTYSASGRIVDGNTGEPISSAIISWTHYFQNGFSSSHGLATNERGEFLRQNLQPGKYSVSALDPVSGEWRTNEVPFEIINEDIKGLEIKTERAAAISGVVVLEGTDDKNAREQLRKLVLYAHVQRQDNLRARDVNLNFAPDGSFRAAGLDDGLLMFFTALGTQLRIVRVERNGLIQTRGIDIKRGEHVAGMRIVLQHANASVRGSVTFENGPIPPGGSVYVALRRLGEDPKPPFWNSQTQLHVDARNEFVAEDLLPGTYELLGGVNLPQERRYIANRQEVVVTAGSVNKVSITLDLTPPAPKP